jgi:hypothetical protein
MDIDTFKDQSACTHYLQLLIRLEKKQTMKITAALLAIAAIACVATIAQAVDQADRPNSCLPRRVISW